MTLPLSPWSSSGLGLVRMLYNPRSFYLAFITPRSRLCDSCPRAAGNGVIPNRFMHTTIATDLDQSPALRVFYLPPERDYWRRL